jgi:DNA-binding NtrC family response regulator
MEILIVDDDAEFREVVCNWMKRRGHSIHGAADVPSALELTRSQQFDVAIVDLNLNGRSGLELLEALQRESSETEVIMLTGAATIETAVEAMRSGAYDYLTKPFPLAELEERCRKGAEHGRLRREADQWRQVQRRHRPATRIVGESVAMLEAMRLIERVAPTDKPVLILGETGVGKDLAASAVHQSSPRANRPFVVVNCAAIPEQLVESELFGHEKGAFTGAVEAKQGLFEIANGGTLFIDEIGELPLMAQPKLLRVLEDGSFRRVGSSKQRRADVRIVAATNRDLSVEVQQHRFREDLWYRINVLSISLPPLRERRDDIPLLVRYFLPQDWTVAPDAETALQSYPWPGNIRQLRNVLDRATVLAEEHEITLDDLPKELVNTPQADSSGPTAPTVMLPDSDALADVERAHILDVMRQCQGNKTEAARTLGIHRRKLYRLLERLHAN